MLPCLRLTACSFHVIHDFLFARLAVSHSAGRIHINCPIDVFKNLTLAGWRIRHKQATWVKLITFS